MNETNIVDVGPPQTLPEFRPFQKIPRWSREITITEKIDGTNGVIWINDDKTIIAAGSRNRWLTREKDNFGFCKWVNEHAHELLELGPGFHYGEWWGCGIQRTYGLNERRFSLFNTARWTSGKETPPACCGVVPVLYYGVINEYSIDIALDHLRKDGSIAAPGFHNPEGIVIYHAASRTLFKKTIEGDEKPKGAQK